MQNVHDANDAKMTIAEMLRDEMQSAHDANDAEVLSAEMLRDEMRCRMHTMLTMLRCSVLT